MKMKNLLQFVFVLLVGQFLFSCNSAKYYEFAASNQTPYKVAKQKVTQEATTAETTTVTEIALAAAHENETKKQVAPMLEASNTPAVADPVKTPKAVNEVVAPENTLTEAAAIAMAKERVENMTSSEKKAFKKELKEVMRQDRGSANIVEIILAIFIPPLAVFLHDGLGNTFWISLLLTLLFLLPGIIYALLIVTDTI